MVHSFLAPYRIPLFAELAKRFALEVWILADVGKLRNWPTEVPADAFNFRLLPHLRVPTGSRDYQFVLNYTLPFALARRRHDVIMGCGWDTPSTFYAAYHARMRKTPFVLWAGSTAGEASWRRKLTRPLVRDLVRHADACVAYGTRSKDYLITLGAEAGRVFCAYNTVDTRRFARESRLNEHERHALRNRLGIRTPRVILYCGQLIERKGLGDLLPAFKRCAEGCSDVTLLVVGNGPRKARFHALAEGLGIRDRVVFAGFVPQETLPPYYGLADLFVLPSREEVWGLVINEALACGVPALTTNAVGAAPDLIRDGVNGYLVPPGDVTALSEALVRHFGPHTDRAAMREAARRSIEPFTIERAADAFVAAVGCALSRG